MSKSMVSKKVIVITGTRKGIGRYLAEYYLNQDCYVLGCSRRETDLGNDNYEHFCVDVSDERVVKRMINSIYRKYNKIDILINNAGIASMNHSLLTPTDLVEKIFKTNLLGTFTFSREVARIMKRRNFGRIVNFTSIAVPLYLEGESIYASSKAAIEELTKVMAKELGQFGITVNAIGPSPIKTDLIKNVGEEKIKKLLHKQAIRTLGQFEDVANVINFYISEKSSMITGQTIYLGGVF